MNAKIRLYAYAINRRQKTILNVPEGERENVMDMLSEADKKRMQPLLNINE